MGNSQIPSSHSTVPEGAFPLSAVQRSMWFAQQLSPTVPKFIAQYVELQGDLDLELLSRVAVEAAHEFQSPFLRLLDVDGEPYQVVDATIDPSIGFRDFRAESDPRATARAWMDDDCAHPLRLTRDRLVDMTVLQVGDTTYWWYTRIHHVALDGYSGVTMVNRIAALYTAAVRGTDVAPNRALDLRELYELDEKYRSSRRFESDREYWAEHIRGIEGGSTLAKVEAPAKAHSRLESALLSDTAMAGVDSSGDRVGATGAAVLISAFSCYLSRMTGREDVLVNIPVSARTTAPLQRSGGMLVNVAPLHITVRPDDTVGDLVGRVQLELVGALRHQRCSLEDIRRDAGLAGAAGALAGPLVNVMLFHQEITLGDLVGEYEIVTSGPVDDLLVNFYQSGGSARTFVDFRGNPDRYDTEELRAHHRWFVELVEEFTVADRSARVGDLHTDSAHEGERIRRAGEVVEFWQRTLAGAPEAIALPFDRSYPSDRRPDHDTVEFRIPRSTAARAAALAAETDSNMFGVVHTALAVLLARLGDTDDVIVGTHNESGHETALRTAITGEGTFVAHLESAHAADDFAFANAELPYAEVLGGADGSGPRPPRLQVALEFAGRPSTNRDNAPPTSADLRWSVSEHREHGRPALRGRLSYATDVFDRTTAQGLAARFVRLFTDAADRPDTPVGDLTLLEDDEKEQLAPVLGAEPLTPLLLPELLSHAAMVNPDGLALIDEERTLTYRELDEQSNRFARVLASRGAGPGSVVALAVARSIESVLATWSVAKSGAAFVPIDPAYPADRIEHMLTDSQALMGITAGQNADRLPDTTPWLVFGSAELEAALAQQPTDALTPGDLLAAPSVAQAAYLIYTSGSTGTPKGVVVTHAGLANFAADQQERYGLTSQSRTLHFSSPSFDASVLELLLAVGAGATMVIAPPTVYGGTELADVVHRHRVTHAFVTPAALASVDPTGLDHVRCVITGGEACPPALVEQWAHNRRMYNAYGPTEATVVAAVSGPLVAGEPVAIGRPPRGSGSLVLDARLHPVPAGVPGELYVCGPGVARGYHRRPATTAQRFIPDPYGRPGVRMYRTGDLARWNSRGELEYLGRTDFQIKIRGYRIELGEIDAVVRSHPGVSFAVTTGHVAPSGDTLLVSYVLAEGDTPVDTAGLLEHAAERLPAHMIPARVVVLDELPMTPAGKLDRNRLPEPSFEAVATVYRAPGTPTESRLADLFTELLKVDRVGVDDSFFDLGGDSLVATRVVSRINAAFATEIGVLDLFEAPSVSQLAERVDAQLEGAAGHPGGSRPSLVAQEHTGAVPVSAPQQRMWFVNQLDTSSSAYNIPIAIRMRGELDRDVLVSALADVMDRQQALRTVFPNTASGPVQDVRSVDEVAPDPVEIDVSAADLPARLSKDAQAGFDVTVDVPLRTRLFRVAPEDHTLLLVAHHIAADGLSMGPLARDVITAYVARSAGSAPDWTPLDVQYTDFTVWQRDMLGGADEPSSILGQQLGRWKDRLAGVPESSTLPLDRPRPARQSMRGATHRFELEADLYRRLRELAAARDVTLFMVLHAALAVLIGRSADTADVSIGSPVSGRGPQELDDLVGMFVNTVVLRTTVDSSQSFADLLADTRKADLAAFADTDVPFELVVDEVQPVRTESHSPLFQIMLVLQSDTETRIELPGLDLTVDPVDTETAKFDLQVIVTEPRPDTEGRAGLEVELSYATELFDRSTMAAVGDRYVRLLEQFADDPARTVGDAELTDPAEYHRVVREWNDTTTTIPERTLVDLFEAQVVRTPEAPALVWEGEPLPYREFDARANRLARALIERGVGSGSRVAVAIRRSLDMMVAIYAIEKAGAAYVPLDPDHPAARNSYVLDSAAPVCVLTTADSATHLPVLDLPVVDVADASTTTHSSAPITDADRRGPIRPDGAAYVIYTSGSTGRPKGVEVSHRSIVNRLLWMQDHYPLTVDDVVMQKTPVTFDVSVWELFWPMQVGARLVVAQPDGHRDPAYLSRLIADQCVTTMHFVPSMLATFVAGADPDACTSLQRVFCSGEALPPATVAAFRRFSSSEIHNLYGPTEAAVDVTYFECTGAEKWSVPIGAPVWNTQVYVLDSRLRPVPVGVPGELYLAGVQLARGYVGRSELTADRFVANPLGDEGARMYRTGDVVRWSGTGNLEYMGRSDFQVKLRGQRIELGEIESALLDDPAVAQAVAVVHSRETTGESLVAYVVPTRGHVVDLTSLRETAATILPAYMVPSQFVILKELPLGATGKLDRKALPEPELLVPRSEYVEPRNPVEEVLASIFAETLGLSRIGVRDDFFDVGGNSLVATRLVARAGEALGVQLGVRDLFDAPTVEAFAMRADSVTERGTAQVPLVPVDRPAHVPVSLAQKRMWFVNQFDTSSPAYNVAMAIRLSGRLDTEALAAAVGDVVERHESLRTRFPMYSGVPTQVVVPTTEVVPSLRPIPVPEGELEYRLSAIAGAGFDVTVAAPVRAELLHTGDDDHVLCIVVHHICADGFSMAPLARDVMTAYAARTAGTAPEWSPLPVQYINYTLWQQRSLGAQDDPDSVLAAQLRYWTRALDGLPELVSLPTDHPRPNTASMKGAVHDFRIDEETHRALTATAREHDTSLFMVIHAALATFLVRLGDSADVAIGTPIAGRGRSALDNVVGMFVNTLVLRTTAEPDTSFSELLAQVRDTDLDAFHHSDVPFERVVDEVAPERSTAHSPLFQVMLEFRNNEQPHLELPGLSVSGIDLTPDISNFDLQLTVTEEFGTAGEPTGLEASFTYATSLFDPPTVERFASYLQRIMAAAAGNPDRPIGDIAVLSDSESTTLTPVTGGRGGAPKTLAEILAAAAIDPDAPALLHDGLELSYGELDARSNQLARALVARGVGPEDVVALAVGRSIESVLSIWAVAKAGAAYVPVDPGYPSDRILHMLTDSGTALVVTREGHDARVPDLKGVQRLVVDSPELRGELDSYPVDAVGDAERVGRLHLDHPAYVIYTSGSTGTPKGVVVSHRGLANFAEDMRTRFGVTRRSRTLHFSSPSFDASVLEFLLAFGSGAAMVIAPTSVIGGAELASVLRDGEVTHAFITPAAMGSVNPEGLDTVVCVATGGDVCPPELVRQWVTPNRRMFNAYGPTEATVVSSVTDSMDPRETVTIGRPPLGCGEMVLDSRLHPVPTGVAGELYVTGAGLARGYHARSATTSDRFIANPFGEPGERMYRTGDLARWNASGRLEYLGRSDFQVKVRGFRIELGEIEAVLADHPSVARAVVTARGQGNGPVRLVGYVVPAEGATVDKAAVRAHAETRLAPYMVPAALMVLDTFPVTPVGKLDRKALPEPDFGTDVSSGRLPANERERVLADIFAEVLGLSSVGTDDSFFALGGDSIMSIQLVARAKTVGLALSPRDVFDHKTVSGLATVATLTDDDESVTLEELEGGGVGFAPATPIVEWLLESGGAFGRMSQSALLTAPADLNDLGELAATFQIVIDRHDMLRARLVQQDGENQLEIRRPGFVDATDLVRRASTTAEPGSPEFATVVVTELEAAQDRLDPFDGPVLQVVWIAEGDKGGRLLVVAHHLVIDGVSWRVMVPDLASAWGQRGTGVETALEPVGTSMRRWAHGLTAAAAQRRDELESWQQILAGDDPLIGARALDPDTDVNATLGRVTVEIPSEVSDALLTTVPDAFRGNVNDGLLAALALAVSRWRRNRGLDVPATLVELEGHGREEQVLPGADLGRTIGWFTSMFPVRLDLTGIDIDDAFAGGRAAASAVKAIKEQLLAIRDHGIGFGMLRYLDPESVNHLRNQRTPQISFNYLGRFSTGVADSAGRVDWTPTAEVDLTRTQDRGAPVAAALGINAVTTDIGGRPQLRATWSYAAGVLDAEEVGELAQLWVRALTAVTEAAKQPDVRALTPSDLRLVALDQTAIDRFEDRYPSLQDIWSLSPLQSGLLFHALLAEQSIDSYTVQLTLELVGADADRMHRAGQALLDRHDNLRAAFVHDSEGTAVQIVCQNVGLPWEDHDLSKLNQREQENAIAGLLEADRARGFDMAVPPLLRFLFLRLGDDRQQLILTNHHILLDGWSMPLVLRDLLTLYATDGSSDVLPAVHPYRRYLDWMADRSTEDSLNAWAEALSGVEEPTLLSPGGRSVTQDGTSHELLIEIPAESTDELRRHARDRGITVSTMIRVAWAIVLAELLGRDDVVFGGTVSGRPPEIPGIESMVGLFINTLPVRVTLDPRETLAELAGRVQSEQADLLDHHYLGLTSVQERVGDAAVFDTLTVFESYPVDRAGLTEATDIAGMHLIDLHDSANAAHYPLALIASAHETLQLKLEYFPALFERISMECIGDRIRRALTTIAHDPDLPLAQLRLLSAEEEATLVPTRGLEGRSTRTLPDLLSEGAQLEPDRIALTCDGRDMSYRDLDERSNRLARALIDRGAGPETTVALGIARSIESVLTMWSIAKTGAAFVPVDPRYPIERVEHMLSDSGAVLGVTVSSDLTTLPGTVPWVVLDDPDVELVMDGSDGARVTDADRIRDLRFDHPAYVIYTSGSTGTPKGVVVSHRGVDNFAEEQRRRYGTTAQSRTLHFSSPSFDASVLDYLLPFAVGATMVIVPTDVYGGSELAELIRRERVTHGFVTPAALASVEPDGLDDFQHVVAGGEAVPAELVTRWSPGRNLYNGYGPTEATIMANISDPLVLDETVRIGAPVRGVHEVVLDGRMQPVSTGVPGELYIAGEGLARGYHRRPGLTAARFVANPFGEPGERMYRTGDVARWLPDHTAEYLGRSDFQVKVRGFRIELGDIDAALTSNPAVGFAVTLGRTGPAGETVLVSYVLPDGHSELDVAEVRDSVARLLPAHMIPASIMVLDEIPLTPVGKLDRNALPEPVFLPSADGFRPPTSETERAVADVFASVLGLERIGVDDNFFDLGGNSLIATRVAARLSAELDTDIGVRSLFEAPTVHQLARLLETVDTTGSRPPLEAHPRPDHVPVSLAQKRMWFLNQFDTTSAAYNIPLVVRMEGALDVDALWSAMKDVLGRHEALRTVFPSYDGEPTQVVLSPAEALPPQHVVEVTESQLPMRVAELASLGFDVTAAVPIRSTLFETGTNDHVLAIVIHHICADGFSMAPLARDVFAAYAARITGTAPQWQRLPVQYADYSLWQHDVLGSEDDPNSLISQQLTYWTDQLAELPEVLALPADWPRPTQPSFRGDVVDFTVEPELHRSLSALSRRHNATMFMTMHAALTVLLVNLTGTKDIAVGTPVAGRGDAALDELVGMFVNTLVLRANVDVGAGFGELLEDIRGIDLEAFQHSDLPFERLVDVIDPERAIDHSPLFQVMLEFRNNEAPRLELPDLTVSGVDFDLDVAKFDLQLSLEEIYDDTGVPAGMQASFTYATDLFDAVTVEAFGERFLRILGSIADSPQTAVGDIESTTVAERHMVLDEWNAIGLAPDAATLADRFAATVSAHREAVAVTYEDESITYQDLDERSNRLARLLIDEGVGTETLVAVALPRTTELVVTILAVIKCGAGYLPVDVNYPAERIAFVLDDARPRCVVTTTDHEAALDAAHGSILSIDSAAVRSTLTEQSPAPITDSDRIRPQDPDAIAYVIYTSGSTGRPKGVVVSHRNVLTLFENTQPMFDFDDSDVWTMFHSYAFDFSVWELWGPLLYGGRLVVVDYYTARSPEMFHELLRNEKVTVLNQTPTAFQQLAETDRIVAETGVDTERLALRYIVFGGEALDLGQLSRWYLRHDDDAPTLVNMYGITETTVHVSHLPLSRRFAAEASASVIGRAIPGLRVYVLDGRLHPTPVGVTGEMYVAGEQVTRGYLGRGALTSTRMVADPHGHPGARMYRTGDVARWNREGSLEYLGRSDFQVKIRGFRIELGEIEAALLRYEGIAHAVVTVHEVGDGPSRLVGYIVPESGRTVDPVAALEFVGTQVTSYMVPATLVALDALPLTSNGKLDRRALPTPDFGLRAMPSRGPTSETERVLVDLFAEVLGLDSVGVDDSFFALGGDSIMSIQLVSRAKTHGVTLTPRAVFEHKTVAGLAGVAEVSDGTEVVVLDEFEGGGVGTMPTTPILEWLLERGGDYRRYTQTALLTLPVDADRDRLEEVLQSVLDHHDMLRSRLVSGGTSTGLRVQAPGSVPASTVLRQVSVASVSGTAFAETANAELDAAAGQLDPSSGSMIRFVWFDAGPLGSRLLVVAHHAVIDGVSWRVLVPDLATAWAQVAAEQPVILPPVGTSMRRWAHALVEVAAERTDELPIWRSILESPDPIVGSRPLDPTVDVSGTVDQVTVTVPEDVTDSLLTALPGAFRGGVNDGLLTALALAVTHWRSRRGETSAQTLVSLEGHGREEHVVPGADLSRTMGWFTSIFPVVLDLDGIDLEDALDGGHSAGSAIKAVKEQLLSIPDHGVGYGLLRYLTQSGAGQLGTLPSPQISFNYLGKIAGTVETQGSEYGWLPVTDADLDDAPSPDIPVATALDVNAMTTSVAGTSQLRATWSYPSGILDRAEVEELASLWVDALTALARHSARPLSGGLTPSDLDLVAVDQQAIDRFEASFPGLSDIWSLSPLQSGLLFHAQFADESADPYMVQLTLKLGGIVDSDRLRAAGQALLDRHPSLRAAFVHDSAGESAQIVQDHVSIPWTEFDFTALESDEQLARLDEVVATDRAKKFDMTSAPLLRMTLVRLARHDCRLIMTNHHILLDGWSTPLVLRDLLTLYATDGDATVLPPVPPYRDYLAWMSRQSSEKSVAAWRKALDGVDEPTVLTSDAEGIAAAASAENSYVVGPQITERLRALSRARGLTMNTVVQSAWAIVLGELVGRDDVVFGGTVSGRPPEIPGIESMIGLFINTLPVRVKLDPHETLGELLDRVQAEETTLLDHHYIGLSDIQNAVGAAAIFDTLTVLESYPVDRAGLTETTDIAGMRVLDVDGHDSAHYPLAIVTSGEEELNLKLEYSTALFDNERIGVVGERIVRALTAIADDPDLTLGRLNLLSDAERAALVPVHGRPGFSVRTLPQILEDAAGMDPNRTALTFGGRNVSYRELDERSNQLARVLISEGAGPETFVALGIPRSIESVLGMWAVAKTGAAFVPVDPNYPSERIEHMLIDSGASIGLTMGAHIDALPSSLPWFTCDSRKFAKTWQSQPALPVADADRRSPISLDNAAYVVYTSGSTGKPKGVVVTHEGLDNFAEDQRLRFGADATSRTLHFSTPSFDGAVFEYLQAFGAGATMVIAPPDVYGGAELAHLLRSERVTHAFITTAALSTVDPVDLEEFQHVAVGGEVCPPELVARWAPDRMLSNAYGPTETTIMANISEPMTVGEPITIGGPIRGVAELVLDSRMQPVGLGMPGELYITGAGLARGYHRRPDLTCGRFVANPYGDPGERMYRTGDVVRWRPDHTIEYVGRTDFQVKIRGFRIELGEIDAELMAQPGVSFAVTVGVDGPAGNTVLASYVVPTFGTDIDITEISARLTTRLPSHMIPTTITVLDEIPLNKVGKLDRSALPEPEFRSTGIDFREPATPMEQTVAEVFRDVLGIAAIGVDDDFFTLGGNSLVATRVTSRLAAVLGADVGVRALFEHPTIRTLADNLESHTGQARKRPALVAGGRPDRIPLSLAQKRMWFLNQFDTSSAAYNIPLAVRLTGQLDITALREALGDTLARHESLRTLFPRVGGEPVQQ
ncbi:MAG: non-ribosomal peptide synthase/polyketide synthase, partial [Rhodococcus sp.]|nr:non-ribosomal peptide synthase/polyketide synthase [Rhodococcus sp. (in: high G+C Gram-positive bacteria)]